MGHWNREYGTLYEGRVPAFMFGIIFTSLLQILLRLETLTSGTSSQCI
jgi:hypothetical protein